MRNLALAYLTSAVVAVTLLAAPGEAGHLVAVPDTDGPLPETPADYDCRVQGVVNRDPPCNAVRWTYGGWCVGDEVAHLMIPDPCCRDCRQPLYMFLTSVEAEFRCVPPERYPFTTYPFDVVFSIYERDWALSTPDCPVPATGYPYCESNVVTIPARTVTSSTDPSRNFVVTFTFPAGCDFEWVLGCTGGRFGAIRWVHIPSQALFADCGQGGTATSRWWIPGLRGANGDAYQSDCSTPCAQYYRNRDLHGEDWIAGEFLTDFGWSYNIDMLECVTPVEETTWGKIKGLMHE